MILTHQRKKMHCGASAISDVILWRVKLLELFSGIFKDIWDFWVSLGILHLNNQQYFRVHRTGGRAPDG